MKQTQTIPETFVGVGYTSDRAGLPLEAVRVPVPRPAADQVLICVAASSLNPLEYKLADCGRCPARARCTEAKRRTITVRPRDQYEALQAARSREASEE